MVEYKTINVSEETKDALDKIKIIEREPYDSVIKRLLRTAKTFEPMEEVKAQK